MLDILIPSIKSFDKIKYLCENMHTINKKIFTCDNNNSASHNRNYCISQSNSEYLIMVDDDISGFYDLWDTKLITPLANKDIHLVSARVKNRFGHYYMNNNDFTNNFVFNNYVYSTCIAFRKNIGVKFDENYSGSGIEDIDFCQQVMDLYGNKSIVINNKVILEHSEEHKNQSKHWQNNRRYFFNKYPESKLKLLI